MSEWQPIETAPISDRDADEQIRLFLWVENGGGRGKGDISFGCVYPRHDGGIKPVASSYSGNGWNITHWMPIPEPPARRMP